jgi:hypothetical protein
MQVVPRIWCGWKPACGERLAQPRLTQQTVMPWLAPVVLLWWRGSRTAVSNGT